MGRTVGVGQSVVGQSSAIQLWGGGGADGGGARRDLPLVTVAKSYVAPRLCTVAPGADVTRHRLVLVGKRAWLSDDIFAAARESGYADEVVFTGYVPDEDLVALYNAADIFVYPSIFEGFGLPPLEAMACGTPVVCSNTSSFPEVVAAAALTVDPLDPATLAQAIATGLNVPDARAQFSARGSERAATFSWTRSASMTLESYWQAMRAVLMR